MRVRPKFPGVRTLYVSANLERGNQKQHPPVKVIDAAVVPTSKCQPPTIWNEPYSLGKG